ncbi:MAG TPA: uracil-DNA glycosylase [Polyangiaceae bacterium]|nr:uracil-DNA glycosylase [Polyangiaceae bacterium]
MSAEREELARLARDLRAQLQWQAELGTTGLPAGSVRSVVAISKAESAAGPATSERWSAPARFSAPPGAGAPPSVGTTVPGGSNRDAASARLVQLADEIRSCQKCPLHAGRTQTVFARGNPAAELCFVGEGPGADEDAQGFPFVGKAGQLLDRMIAAMGFLRDDVYVCNVVKCRPPSNRKPEPDEMAQCTPYLREQLELVAPKVIVALGATAVEGLIGTSGGITRLRGQWKLYRTIPVMPTFHPAYLLRNPAAKREVWADLQAVLKQMGRPLPPAGRSA